MNNKIDIVADWFLTKEEMTPKKLQKLVYYAYAWYLTLMNEDVNNLNIRLFGESPQAWVHGPVFPTLYHKYKRLGAFDIPMKLECNYKFNKDELDLLEQVWSVYGKYNGNQLESITHQEQPWKEARNGCSPYEICTNVISDESIFKYYSKRLA